MEPKQMQIRAKDEDLKGVYANSMMVTHTRDEFCLDFVNMFNPPILTARIITSPTHLKRMIATLQENMQRYEEQFGEIQSAQAGENSLGFQSSE
jgi:hypothetical protein